MSSITVCHDLRVRFGPARDQGPRPTCLAFATSDVHAAVRDTAWSELSCEFLFYHAVRRQGSSHTSGVRISSICDALEQDGQPIEAAWPYLKVITNSWKPPAKVGKVFRRASKPLAGGFDGTWRKVMSGTPVLIGMSISDAFFNPLGGMVDSAEAVDASRRHAVVAVAAGEKSGSKLLMVRNSWGASWGKAGYAWVAERYMRSRIIKMITIN